MPSPPAATTVTMRPAGSSDAEALAHVAALDSRCVPTGTVLVGLVDDRIVAVISLDDGHVVADPFTPTAELVELLRARARAIGLAAGATSGPWKRRMRRVAALRG